MKRKLLKIVTVILLLALLTMPNFIFVGSNLISYAVDNITTNHQNVEFDAQIKEGDILELLVNVKKEGYFKGEITLENSNFKFKLDQENAYVHKIENNKVILNQINAESSVRMELQIEHITDETFNIGLLDMSSNVSISGVYKDSTEKDIKISSTKEIKWEYEENNTNENVENTAKVITNQVMKIAGEDKRVVQLEINLGLKENNYPIKEMKAVITLPDTASDNPEIVRKIDFNTMKAYSFSYNEEDDKNLESTYEINFNNQPDNNNTVLWKKQGNEKVILSLIYDKDVTIKNTEIPYEETILLYDGKELKSSGKILVDETEKEDIINLDTTSTDEPIYKGNLYTGIDRQYETRTNVSVNLSKIGQYINIKEEDLSYLISDEQKISANAIFDKTIINKESFDRIFGENGQITIFNETGEIITSINNKTIADENNNIVIDYSEKELRTLHIKTSVPINEGNIEIRHIRRIQKQEKEIVKAATALYSKTTYEYNVGVEKETIDIKPLEETRTAAKLIINKDTLSTVVENSVEIKAILKGDNEQYNLYSNPKITFELPEGVENVTINDIKLIYENELRIKNYDVNGRIITVYLEGMQTTYKDISIEGAIIILNTSINVNSRTASKDSKIVMTIENESTQTIEEKGIKIVAPKDVTAINSIKELGVETIGQEELNKVALATGVSEKYLEVSIEVINNNENAIENVKILGTFPTKNKQNNIGIEITEGISIEEIEGVKVYYTENEYATDDIEDQNNLWKEQIEDSSTVQKYLIEIPNISDHSNVKGTYKIKVPELLEYNQSATEGYIVKYTNYLTKVVNEVKSTNVEFETGIGPVLEVKLVPTIGGVEASKDAKVKNAEVIKYKLEISNTGSEDLTDVTIVGSVPEGTTLVIPMNNYEYTGSNYYQELDNKQFESKIDKISVGEVITGEYEVRVNNNIEDGTKLVNKLEVKYRDVIKESNETELVTESGELKVTVKRITDRRVDLYESGNVRYFAIVENISDKTKEDINIKTNLPDGYEVEKVNLITGMESSNNLHDNVETETIEYGKNINIGSLEKGKIKVLSYDMIIGSLENSSKKEFSVIAKADKEYRSNVVTDNVKEINVSLNLTASTQNQYVESGDTLEYIINVKNNGTTRIEGLRVKDEIPQSLTVNKITLNNQEIQTEETNDVSVYFDIEAQSEAIIKIETTVNYSATRTSAEAITNVAYAEMLGEKVATTGEINHIIKANTDDNKQDETDNPTGDIAKGTGIISGMAWFDENANGKRDDNEKILDNVKVYLLNTQTNNLVKTTEGKVLEAKTNDRGIYVLDNIENGKYIVVFDYNKTLYTLTKYKVENVEENKNSNAVMNELLIQNEKQLVASTDIIEINNQNVSDINIGLIELKDFAFRLDKYVTRMLIQNSAGTTIKEYTDSSLAKAELDRKILNGTTVIIEYELRVTNIGEIDGYIRKIVDYVPNDLEFNSELNKEWYQLGNDLYTTSLANDKIAAGESKSVKLTLTKAMTENNTGLINNTAEIAESYNELGIADSKSTPGNKAQGENDYSSADAILSVKTGGDFYISIISVFAAVIVITTILIIRKIQNNGDEN